MFGRIHRAQSVALLRLAYRIGVVEQCCRMVQHNTIFYNVILHACVHGRRKDLFQGGALVDFSKSFFRGDESGEICFLPLETNKTAFFAEVFKLLPSSRHPCLCAGKSSCHTIQNWCNLKRFNTILNCKILLNLVDKMKYLTDQFQLCFRFCIGNTKQLYLFLH